MRLLYSSISESFSQHPKGKSKAPVAYTSPYTKVLSELSDPVHYELQSAPSCFCHPVCQADMEKIWGVLLFVCLFLHALQTFAQLSPVTSLKVSHKCHVLSWSHPYPLWSVQYSIPDRHNLHCSPSTLPSCVFPSPDLPCYLSCCIVISFSK